MEAKKEVKKLNPAVAAKYDMVIPFTRIKLAAKFGGGTIAADTLTLERANAIVEKGFKRLRLKKSTSK